MSEHQRVSDEDLYKVTAEHYLGVGADWSLH